MLYEDKCGNCLYFVERTKGISKVKGDCKKNRQVFTGVSRSKPKCKLYKPKVSDLSTVKVRSDIKC